MFSRPQYLSGEAVLAIAALLSAAALVSGAKHPAPLLLPCSFAALATLSAVWSDNPLIAFRYALALAVPLFIAGQIAANVQFDHFLAIADWSFRAIVAVSMVVALVEPSIGLQGRVYDDALRGLFAHKNGMGFIVTIAVVTLLARNWRRDRRALYSSAWLLVYLAALIWANSVGAIALVLLSLGIYCTIRWFAVHQSGHRAPLSIAILCFGTAGAIVIAPFASTLFQVFGKDLTFTGRIYIWEGAIVAWRENFWLGYGWANILGEEDQAARAIRQIAGYSARSTHNGYLATALQLGIAGFVLSLAVLIWLLLRTWKGATVAPGPQSLWSLQIVLILILGDFIETRAFTNLGWFLLCVVAYYSQQLRVSRAALPFNRLTAGHAPGRSDRPSHS